MFARSVALKLKSNTTVPEFTQLVEKEVLPLLRNQRGFQEEIAFAPAPGGLDLVAISFWDTKESADAYDASAYPEVVKMLSKVIDGTPQVRGHEVLSSTFDKAAVHVAA
jgi:heme-degrading monooxygenase HmoA